MTKAATNQQLQAPLTQEPGNTLTNSNNAALTITPQASPSSSPISGSILTTNAQNSQEEEVFDDPEWLGVIIKKLQGEFEWKCNSLKTQQSIIPPMPPYAKLREEALRYYFTNSFMFIITQIIYVYNLFKAWRCF